MDKNVAVYGTLLVLLLLEIALIKASIRRKISDWFNSTWEGFLLLPLTVLFLNTALLAGTGNWSVESFFGLILYFSLPMTAVALGNLQKIRQSKWGNTLIDLSIIVLLWLPMEFSLFKTIFAIKENYFLITFSAVIFGLILYTGFRKRELSLDWSFKKDDLRLVGKFFFFLAIIFVPVTLAIGFTKLGLSHKIANAPYLAPLWLIGIWFAPALVEETIFRGIIQNVLIEKLKPALGIIIASVIFGFSHLNNKEGGYRFPNWPYVILATVAGLAYGYVYYRRKAKGSKNALGTSALLHCLVDFIWFLFLRAR